MKEIVKWLKEIAYLLYVMDFRQRVKSFGHLPASKEDYIEQAERKITPTSTTGYVKLKRRKTKFRSAIPEELK